MRIKIQVEGIPSSPLQPSVRLIVQSALLIRLSDQSLRFFALQPFQLHFPLHPHCERCGDENRQQPDVLHIPQELVRTAANDDRVLPLSDGQDDLTLQLIQRRRKRLTLGNMVVSLVDRLIQPRILLFFIKGCQLFMTQFPMCRRQRDQFLVIASDAQPIRCFQSALMSAAAELTANGNDPVFRSAPSSVSQTPSCSALRKASSI